MVGPEAIFCFCNQPKAREQQLLWTASITSVELKDLTLMSHTTQLNAVTLVQIVNNPLEPFQVLL